MKDLIYFEMRAYLYNREEQQSVSLKLSELEKLWYCTQKNVKRRLKQFEAAGKLTYKPGKGRGHSSRLIFLSGFQEEIEKTVLQLVQNEKMEAIILLLQLPIPKAWIANVSKEVQALFGLHVSEQSKDVLRTMVTRNLTTLDPLHSSITFETYLIHQLGDSLLAYHQEQDLLQPHLAHSWEQQDDGRIWTFYLRKGVRFHNGHGLTSEDVRATFQRFQDHDSAHSWLTEDIRQIDCPSPYSIVFTLNKPNLLFPRYVSSHNLAILPANEPFDERKWIGTGPFRLKKRTDQLLVLQAFDDYFLTRPLLDEIEFYKVDPGMASSHVYEIASEASSAPSLQKSDIEVGFRFLAFNFKKKTIVHHPSFREAIYHLADMNKLSSASIEEELQEASSYFPWKSEPQRKELSKVSGLLKEAGYNGEPLKVFILDKKNELERGKLFQEEALKAGIHFEIQSYTLDQYYDPFLEQADLLFMGEVASTDYHLSFMGAFLNKALIFNRFLAESHMNRLNLFFEKIKQAPDRQTREELIEETEDYIKKENLFIYLYHPMKNRTFHPMIRDIQFESFGYVDFRRMWIKENRG
ncbi:hypothetical protein CEF21_07110 [Bacillus sp. FJAT-42376]|uniref:ABC transporter substrate-binding protein n=1 Tax=Bacillus sp. FJAT-42376 TaxID=2014076 RepID=UPI000F4FAFA1|nr:ABC transporter substrate-binding protein [Bacillus sp. FJAT-42376]AZB42076.1 hypothetical protein CEF21_07110 [Bacillus sp. FJAT-42376]